MADKDEQKPKAKEQRYHVERDGVRRKIVDTYYDSKLNVVLDVYEVTRIVRNSEKKPVEVTTLRRAVSQNQALQDKYRVNPTIVPRREVKIDE